MTSKSQFSLFPEIRDQREAFLHGLEPIAGELTDFADGVQAQMGDLILLEVSPDGLNRIEFRDIRRETRDRDMAVQLFEPGREFSAAMNRGAVPDDQQRLFDLALERTEELDDLFGADSTGKESEVELPERKPRNRRQLFPGEAVLKDRCLAAHAPGTCHAGTFAQSGFVDEDNGASFSLGFF